MDQNEILVCKTHTTTYIALFVVGLIVGTIASGWIIKQNTPDGVSGENTYEAGWNAAKARLTASPQFGVMMNTPDERKTLSGVVESVTVDKVSIKINPLEPLASPTLDSRVIIITSATKITRIVQPDQETFQKEMEAFKKSMQTAPQKGTVIKPPEQQPHTKQDAILVDIKVGDTITATAVENIKEIKEFTAIEIQIN